MKYFIYVIKAGITALSENTESQIKMTIKTQNITNQGDRIIGFCENPISEYRYIFSGLSMANGKITLSKILQILNGVKSNSIIPELDKKIQEEIISGNDLIEITMEQYQIIENAILEQIGRDLNKKILNDTPNQKNSSYTRNFSQIIYYGVPGSGKSHRIDEKTKNLSDEQKMRVVFHPEYTNSDFIGQILPVQINGDLEYPFKAGPFTRILKRALKNPDKPYYLIIEEINRGNAAAIFGNLFQLLDRKSDGWSSYSIENLDINAFIRSEDERYSEKTPPTTKKVGNIEFNENTSLRIPPNLFLLATMNTSDQNVFTLDNAFQRRWDMKLVENKFEGDDAENQRTAKIGGSNVTWEQFQTHINKRIGEMSSSMGMSSMEDKRLGCWFVKAEDGKISKEQFAEKVLKYLWDDAFKFSREEIFDIKDKTSSLESIVSAFKNGDESASCNWTIFKDTSFISQQDNVQAESDAGETE